MMMRNKLGRDTAEKIVLKAAAVGTSLSDLGHAIRNIEDEDTRRAALWSLLN